MRPGELVAVAIGDGGVATASAAGTTLHPTGDPLAVLRRLDDARPRWVWWSARETVAPWSAAGWRPRACWDLAAVSRLLAGGNRDDPVAVWSAHRGVAAPPAAVAKFDLLGAADDDTDAVRSD